MLGIDEAGRGPLAGPLTVAGVVFPIGYENPDIYDSKSLSGKKRDELYDIIMADALYFAVKIVSEADIDRYNIYRADQLAMAEIAADLQADITKCINTAKSDWVMNGFTDADWDKLQSDQIGRAHV